MFKKMIFLFSVMVLILSLSVCNSLSPTGPEDPEDTVFHYRSNIKVVYVRDVSKIIFPKGNDRATAIYFIAYDPDNPGSYSSECIGMEKVAEKKFVGYIDHVFVQTGAFQRKHELYIRDTKLYDGVGSFSMRTGNVKSIQGAYDIEKKASACYFRMEPASSGSNSSSTLFIQE